MLNQLTEIDYINTDIIGNPLPALSIDSYYFAINWSIDEVLISKGSFIILPEPIINSVKGLITFCNDVDQTVMELDLDFKASIWDFNIEYSTEWSIYIQPKSLDINFDNEIITIYF